MDAKGVYRTMLQSDSTDFSSRVARWSQRHYDFGQAILESTKPGSLILHRTGYPTYMLPWFVMSQAEYMAVLERLRGVLERWIEQSNDQGRIPEPPDVTARKGLTKAGTRENPSKLAIIGSEEPRKPGGKDKKR